MVKTQKQKKELRPKRLTCTLDRVSKVLTEEYRKSKSFTGGLVMSNKNVTRGRGRPAVYTGNQRRHIESLVRHHGATNARKILNAANGTAESKLRNSNVVTEPLGISMPTLLKFAKAAGVVLHRGRPCLAKVEVKPVAKKARKAKVVPVIVAEKDIAPIAPVEVQPEVVVDAPVAPVAEVQPEAAAA